jgi:hypothetical protein
MLLASLNYSREVLTDYRPNYVRRQGAHAQPLLHEVFLEGDPCRVDEWIVGSKNLEETTISLVLPVGSNDTVRW